MDPATKCQKEIHRKVRLLTQRLIALLMQSNCTHATISLAVEHFPLAIETSMEALLYECFQLLQEELAEEKARHPFRFDN